MVSDSRGSVMILNIKEECCDMEYYDIMNNIIMNGTLIG